MAAPYDSLELVVNTARARLNDMIVSAGGDILTDANVFTLTVVTGAWRKLQEFLAKLGFLGVTNEATLAATAGSVTQINWTTSPALPSDFIVPYRMWERIASVGGNYLEMDKLVRGLPKVPAGAWNRYWEWRTGSIYLPGTAAAMDYIVRYGSFLPDFVASGTTAFASQPVPIMRCLDAFSLYIAAEMAGPRGDIDAAVVKQMAEEAATILVARENPLVLNLAASTRRA